MAEGDWSKWLEDATEAWIECDDTYTSMHGGALECLSHAEGKVGLPVGDRDLWLRAGQLQATVAVAEAIRMAGLGIELAMVRTLVAGPPHERSNVPDAGTPAAAGPSAPGTA